MTDKKNFKTLLNSDLSTTYSEVETGYSYTPMNRLCRNGKNRSLSFALRSDVPINNDLYNVVANITDEKDYPMSEIRSSCFITKVSDGQILGVGEVKIDTYGNISIKSSVGENYNEIYMNVSWITL